MEKLTRSYLHFRAKSIADYEDWIGLLRMKADPVACRKAQDERDISDAQVRQLKNHIMAALKKFAAGHWPKAEILPDGKTALPIGGVWSADKGELIQPNGVRD